MKIRVSRVLARVCNVHVLFYYEWHVTVAAIAMGDSGTANVSGYAKHLKEFYETNH